jgi:hypothetical protein
MFGSVIANCSGVSKIFAVRFPLMREVITAVPAVMKDNNNNEQTSFLNVED